ncbi:MAG: hypothetical protein HON70_27225, partial [Lentisphaerae bacterium]|nr:hypothetical protein [Lentisphaerota bacterium]
SRYWLDVAAKEAALEHFSIAEAELARTRYSWDRKLYEHEIDELARKIPRWESTCGQWRGVVTDMREGDHDNANNGLVPLVARPLGDWQWKRKARAYGTQAGRLKKLLESYQRGKKAMAKADATLDQLQRCTEGITSVVDELSQQAARPSVLPEGAGSPSAGLTSYPPTSGEQEPENGPLNVSIDEWGELSEPLNGLIKKACELVQELQAPGAAWQDLQDSLACCRDWPPPADEELEGLMRAAREISGKVEWPFLKAPAEELITKLNSARERLTALKEARAYVCDGCFREGVELLTADHWDGQKLDPNASPLKALLISISNSGNSLRTQAAAIEPRYKRVQNLVSQNGQYFRDGKHLRDASVLSGIYAVDSLDSPYPARNQLAVGNYDKYLSRAEFYAFLSSPDSSLGETSILAKCVLTVRAVEELVGESRRADYRWMFAEGNLKKEIDSLAGSVLEPRKRIIHATLAHANDDSRGPRERIIAAGIASALASEGDELTIGEENQRKKVGDWISGQLNELKRKLQELDGPYELAAPERKIEIRTEVLATGIPGQNVVQKMWRRRPHTGQGQ